VDALQKKQFQPKHNEQCCYKNLKLKHVSKVLATNHASSYTLQCDGLTLTMTC